MQLPEKMLTVLSAVAEIQRSRNEEEAFVIAAVKLGELDYPLVMLSLVQEIDGKRYVVARPDRATGPQWEMASKKTMRLLDGGTDLLAKILHRRQSRFVRNSQNDPLNENDEVLSKEIGIVSQYAIPLFTESLLIGTIQIDLKNVESIVPEEALILDAFAAHLSLAIERLRVIEARDRINQKMLSHAKLIAFDLAAAKIMHGLNRKILQYGKELNAAIADQNIRVNERALRFLQNTKEEVGTWRTTIQASISTIRSTESPTVIYVDTLVKDAVAYWHESCHPNRIKLILEAGAPTATIRGNQTSLFEIISCLLTNSIDAKAREIRINTKFEMRPNLDDDLVKHVVISISDNGSGFSPQSMVKTGSLGWTTKGQSGHGMGLVLVELLATQFGGRFSIKSPGKASGEAETEIAVWIPVSDQNTESEK